MRNGGLRSTVATAVRRVAPAGLPYGDGAVEFSLKAAFDVSCLSQSRAGTARVARGLLRGLEGIDDLEVVSIGDGGFRGRGSVAQRGSALRQDLVWYAAGRSRAAARRASADVVHFPTYRGPLRSGSPPMVVTVLDLAVLREPSWFPAWARFHARALLRPAVRAAVRVIAISQQTADDVVDLLDVPRERVRVVECGIEPVFSLPPSAMEQARPPFLLGVATPEPRKNLVRLLEAFALVRAAGGPDRLVLVGADGWGAVHLEPQAGVELAGRVSDERLRDLYCGAEALVFPSLWEGFGLPVGEALAAGCRVVCSDLDVLREVAGDRATYVDPLDPSAIAAGIERSLGSQRPVPARAFTWERAGRLTFEVWREVVG